MWRTILGEAWRAVASARRASASSVVIIALCLAILGVVALLALAIANEARDARRWVTVEVFLRDEVPDGWVPAVRAAISRQRHVSGVRYVTRDEAAARFRAFFDPALLDAVESNPLPRSFVVELADAGRTPAGLRALSTEVGRWPEVEAVHADIEWLAMLNRLVAGAAIVLFVLLLGIGIAMSIVIARTISLGLSARLPVVAVQRLLGASERVVRMPFAIVGLAQGLLGGAIAGGAVLLGSRFAAILPLVGDRIGGSIAHGTALGLLVLGAALGWWGARSAIATTLPPDPWFAGDREHST